MIHTVSFPGLGLEFEINRAINIGSLTIYWYAIIIAFGFFLAMEYFFKDCKTFGLDSDRATNVIFVVMILGIIGARAYYVLFNWDYFAGDISRMFDVRSGGLGFYGGIIGGLLGVVIGCRIWKVPMKPLLDIVAIGLFIGQGIGRWGNFVNGECFGVNTDLPWGMTGSNITSYILSHTEEEMGAAVDPFLPVHPTFLYESLWCFIGLAILLYYRKRRKFDGEMFLMYIVWNGFGRMLIEGLRTDSLMIGSMRVSQVLGGVMAAVSICILYFIRSKIKKSDDENYLIRWADTEEGRLQADGKWDYVNNCQKETVSEPTPDDTEENTESDENGEKTEENFEEPENSEETKENIKDISDDTEADDGNNN